jgi:hypothetical protein
MSGILDVEEPDQLGRQPCPVRNSRSEDSRCLAMILTAVPALQPNTAHGVGRGYSSEHGKSGGDVEVLVSLGFIQDKLGNLDVRLRSLQVLAGVGNIAGSRSWDRHLASSIGFFGNRGRCTWL